MPGDYSITVEFSGFKREIVHSVHVAVAETAVVKVKLEIANAATQVVEVSGASGNRPRL